jgi:hypothetical protein
MSRFPNRRWMVIPTSLTGSIDFREVLESSVDSLRLSIDGSKTFVKYEVNEVTASYSVTVPNPETEEDETYTIEAGVYGRPSFYSAEYPEYNHQEILNLLTGSEWVAPFDEDQLS